MKKIKKNKNLGSSETTREASIYFAKKAFSSYVPYCPQHKKLNPMFLEWFLGFLEGQGIFQYCEINGSLRFAVKITQNDEVLLRNIRKELGFGRIVFVTANDAKKYAQLVFDTKQGVLAMLYLCAGNLRLHRAKTIFQSWSEKVCQRFTIPMPVNPHGLASRPLSLDNAWISGFFQAEGCFNAQYREDGRTRVGYRVKLKVFFDQKSEHEILTQISTVLGGLVRPCNKSSEDYRLNIEADFVPLVTYLTRFPLRGRKKISQVRWFRVYNYLQNHELPEIGTKSHTRFMQLIKNGNACQGAKKIA